MTTLSDYKKKCVRTAFKGTIIRALRTSDHKYSYMTAQDVTTEMIT